MNIILFDIDYTLLNTTAMAQNLSNMISQETGLSSEEVENYMDRYTEKLEHVTHFDFIELIETLSVDTKTKKRVRDKYFNNSEIYTKYPEVDEVLEELQTRGYRIGIF